MSEEHSQPLTEQEVTTGVHRPGMGSHQKNVGIRKDHSLVTDEWLTPPYIIESLGPFDLDPCSPVARPWDTAAKHYTKADNGLLKPWKGSVWCNPPYSNCSAWLERCREQRDALVLLFARTETEMWQKYVWAEGAASAVLFIFGRLYFHRLDGTRADANAGASSAIVAYGEAAVRRLERRGFAGRLVRLTAGLR